MTWALRSAGATGACPATTPRELLLGILRHVPKVEVSWLVKLAAQAKCKLVAGIGKLDE